MTVAKTISLPTFGITLTLDGSGSGSVFSRLHEGPDHDHYNTAIHALESMILACACAGIDVESPAFLEAIDTTVTAISEHYGDE